MRGRAVTSKLGYGRHCLVGLLTAGLMAAVTAGTASASTGVSCTTYRQIPVALAAGQPLSYTVTGELCATPGELARGETVQLLVHGATYNHSYWDFGTIDGVGYSYARDAAVAGFPSFAMDEIGAGASSHPPSSAVTIQAAAFVAHQIVQDLRHGSIGKTAFGKVIIVGHSFGSIAIWDEAATYHDVAGAIVTGAAHSSPVFDNAANADFYPAIDDPKFANSGLDSAYLTTVPGTRASLFYNTADSDPNVIAADEASKDVFSATELSTGLLLASPASTLSAGINVPVLVILGSQDALFCGPQVGGGNFDCSSGSAITRQEAPHYSAHAQLRACAVPGSGHDLNLALNHVFEEADAITWAYEYVGQTPLGIVNSHQLPPDCS
jgi:pimeloyl-ACP methyl ester carboxylesterase